MPGPQSRTVTATCVRVSPVRGRDLDAPASTALARRVLGVDQDVEQRLLQQQRDRTYTGGSFSPCSRSTTISACAAGAPRGSPARASGCDRSASLPAIDPVRAGEDQQVVDDLRGAIAPPGRSASARFRTGLAAARHVDEELEMAEDALQRVVHLVRDAGDELAERRELFRLRSRSRSAARSASSRVCRVMSRATSTRPSVCAVLRSVSGVAVSRNVPFELLVVARAAAPAGAASCGSARRDVGERVGADEVASAAAR